MITRVKLAIVGSGSIPDAKAVSESQSAQVVKAHEVAKKLIYETLQKQIGFSVVSHIVSGGAPDDRPRNYISAPRLRFNIYLHSLVC
jgi:hypothetical protein